MGTSKLNREQVLTIRQLLKDGVAQREIAHLMSVSTSNISKINRNLTWWQVQAV